MMDKYDKAIEHLTLHPEQIKSAWSNMDTHIAGCLFAELEPKPNRFSQYGCPTMVKNGKWEAFTAELTEACRRNSMIPAKPEFIGIENLSAFAEIQRLADVTLKR